MDHRNTTKGMFDYVNICFTRRFGRERGGGEDDLFMLGGGGPGDIPRASVIR